MSSVRRVFSYLITLITLGIFAAGVRLLLFLVFDAVRGPSLAGTPAFDRQQLSLSLAMIFIGGPLWFFFWRAIQRRVAGNPDEIGAVMRKLYLNLVLFVSALTGLFAADGVLRWLLAGVPRERFVSGSLAILLVTTAIWFYHRHISESEGHPSRAAKTLRRWYIYLLSGWGLVWISGGLVQFVNTAILSLPVWGTTLVSGSFWNDASRGGISWILLGGGLWKFHWFRMAKGDLDSTLRQVYLYLFAILGSSVAGLIMLAILFYRVFNRAFGATGPAYFQFLSWAIPGILVAAAVWSYHQRVAFEEGAQVHLRRLSAERVHSYLMAFLGLGTMVSGLIVLIGIFLDLIINSVSPSVVITPGWWRSQLSLCLALLLVGTPIWWYYWNAVLRRTVSLGVIEQKARSRRIFLYGIVAVAIVALAAALVNIVYQLLTGALTGAFDINLLRRAKWSLQALVVAAPILFYHWEIIRQDSRRGAEAAAERKSVTALINEQSGDLVSRLEDKLGYDVRILYTTGEETGIVPILTDEEIDALAESVQKSLSSRVMLIAQGDKIIVTPYREK